MKTIPVSYFIAIIICAIVCPSACRSPKGDLPYIDANKNYPQKEIYLSDIAHISYLHLNTDNEDYLYSGTIRCVTENTLVIATPITSSGDILFFSKEGTPKSRFNRQGNGPGEYRRIRHIFYDESVDDVFVVNDVDPCIRVYSSSGATKRDLPLPDGVRINNDIVSFDDQSLLFYDAGNEFKRAMAQDFSTEIDVAPFYLISKKDGEVLDYFELPVTPIFLGIYIDGNRIPTISRIRLIKNKDGALLCIPENDTVFLYTQNRTITPVLHKIPLASTTNPITYLNNCIDVSQFQFTEIYTVQPGDPYPGIFPVNYYMRNKKTGEICRPKLLLPEYTGMECIISPSKMGRRNLFENEYYFELDLTELKQAYTDNKLSGKLKQLVATLKDDDNDVIVIVDFKR